MSISLGPRYRMESQSTAAGEGEDREECRGEGDVPEGCNTW